ncbi:MAG: iron-sulfur cluster assembly scaffold protein [Nanoarchaeota archaeon]
MRYSKEVMKNFMDPKNMGEIKNPDGVGKVGNPTCGDIMHVFIKVGKKGTKDEFIKDIKFQTFGCAAAIATSSMITQLAKGEKISDAKKIKIKNIAKSLKGLPEIKMHCGEMAAEALGKAIEDYNKKKLKGKRKKGLE